MIENSFLARHYESCSEGLRLTKSRVRRLEFETTLQAVRRHISPGDSLLELGAGHGAYSLYFGRRGYNVFATDLVPANFGAMLAQVKEEGLQTVRVSRADGTNLGTIPAQSFNA